MNNIRDKKIWIFNATNSFIGNPKWLFIYVNKYRPDITAYWMCDDEEVINRIRNLGYNAELYSSKKADKIKQQAGVFVVHQVKEHIPVLFKDEVVILNLWHGVGCKSIERKVNSVQLKERIYKKYIKYNSIFKNNQLFLVTSPLMEKHFKEQVGIDDDKIIRAGYPAVTYKESFSSYNHDILKEKGLPEDTKIALYAPTFRDGSTTAFFGKSIPDMDKLVKTLKENNMLMIFKMHYLVNNDYQYNLLKEKYKDCPHLLFWNEDNDIYEIFNKIDIAIMDYSSIFYDLLAAGVKHFTRYIFDYDEYNNLRDFVFDYKEMTFGQITNNFEELLEYLSSYEDKVEEDRREEIYDLFWEYTNDNSFEEIIEKTLKFSPEKRDFPTLYSFDLFDTLIQRKTLEPVGIFFYVGEAAKYSRLKFPSYLVENYPRVRAQAESYVRDYYRKSLIIREDDRLEIFFDDIMRRLQDLYHLTDQQVEFLKAEEFKAEIENIEPMKDRVEYVAELVNQGNDVVLISDMYLPKEVILEMLKNADERLAELPLFLSSDYGDQKTTRKLYLRVFEEMNYNYSKWVHYGDNQAADLKAAKSLNIQAVHHHMTKFNAYEKQLVNRTRTYDSYLASNLLARFRETNNDATSYYAYSYVSMYFVPYIHWAIKHAMRKGIDTLYFISRDGYYLKLVADSIIETNKYDIKTKYIYGSRKAWRIPSFIDKVDEEFYSVFGNFEGMADFGSVLDALSMNESKFDEIFPELSHLKTINKIDKNTKEAIKTTAKNSLKYEEYLLNKAKEDREIITKYLKQEIDFSERFAFVEYWGRGYTQDCLDRLLNDAYGSKIETIFYYARSIYPTTGTSVRYNYTSKMTSLIFIESIFANIPYQSITGYYEKDGIIKPVIKSRTYETKLHDAIKEHTVEFIKHFYSLPLTDEDNIERSLYDYAVDYFRVHPTDHYILNVFAPLKDSVRLYEPEVEYAPEITLKKVMPKLVGKPIDLETKNMRMSLARSSKGIKFLHRLEKKYFEKIQKRIRNRMARNKKILKNISNVFKV
ncbi:CDP-glycerol glycerophosphotransferase family protein [Bacillus safensis]|uniref:CDP-glycerol glycerophosphotransferase family protein n=1 Tax=Bacillus safensis TaxID=561879 RepID=UPI001E36C88F|nr:CDP-glycerol glycerophosphotransferase family protein [Bacillus safensis]MED4993392.1 CDP-glycerol glycerophosphotransferase family protein [Bacillus safensis]UDB46077.1 CDP-glycerol glycerophosphotransferase family protein [Bacillus safensis]